MIRASQSELERAYYLDFDKHFPEAPRGHIVFSDKPDVLIKGKDLLGIEITRLYKEDGNKKSSLKSQIDLRENVIRQAEAIYRQTNNPKFEFWFDFNPEVSILNIKKTAKRLAACVQLAIQERRQLTFYNAFDKCPEIRFMTYSGVEYENATWRSAQVYDVPELNTERVIDIIRNKAIKVAKYQPCDRYWLLVIVEFWDPAQDQTVVWDAQRLLDIHPFEKVIIYKPATKEWLEVPKLNQTD